MRNVSFLTALQKRKRTAWADEYKDFNAQQWGDIIWSDECYIHLNDKSGWVYVPCHANEEYDENCVIPTFKQSSVCVMFWGCIMKGRKGPLVVLEYTGGQGGGMTGQIYICPGGSPQLLLSPNKGRETWSHVSAGWCTKPY